MTTITIPKKNSKAKELVAIPREEYEELLSLRKSAKVIKEFIPTVAQKRALAESRKVHARDEYLTIDELKNKLGIKNSR